MNICFFMGKIVSDLNSKSIIHDSKNISIAKFEVELNNKSIIIVIGYNEMADFCYRKLKKYDNIAFQGYLDREIKVILEKIALYQMGKIDLSDPRQKKDGWEKWYNLLNDLNLTQILFE